MKLVWKITPYPFKIYESGEILFNTLTFLVRQMVSSLGQKRQWNYAVGLGPRIDGSLPEMLRPAIENMGRFMSWASESIYDTTGGEGSPLNPGWFVGI